MDLGYIMIYLIYATLIGVQGDCFKTDPLRGQNQLLSTLIHSYPLLSTLIPLLSTLIPLLSTLIQLLSNSYPTLIHSYSLLILRVMLFTLIHSYPLLTNMVISGSMGFILIWNGVSMAKIVAQNGSQRERLGCSGWLQVDTGAANVCWECWHAKKHMK